MKRVVVSLLLVSGMLLPASCGERSCEKGAGVTAPWDKLGLPVGEGGSICYSYENALGIVHYNAANLELIHKYQNDFAINGWVITPVEPPAGSDMRFLKAVKGDKRLSISSSNCTRMPLAQYFSKCGLINITEWKDSL